MTNQRDLDEAVGLDEMTIEELEQTIAPGILIGC
jgi:hypothetical protein